MELSKSSDAKVISHIRKKRKELNEAGIELKKHFVALDEIIDKILRDIETWYIMPELLSRPIVICLWGLTGVGKTDLVRRLVKILNFSDRYCEVELKTGSGGSYSYCSTISSILGANANIKSGEPSVVLLDEIQNFRTVDENRDEIAEYAYRDVWQLLSDGKLPYKADTDYLFQLLWEYKPKGTKAGPDIEDEEEDENINEEDEKPSSIKKMIHKAVSDANSMEDDDETSYYSLKHFKTILRLEEPLDEIALWSNAKKRQVILSKLGGQDLYEEEDYTKSLIFISGNLDEVYTFATDPEEVDIDADIFHELSAKINILDVKRELTHRFKPEQIARFGNNQVIYKSLSKSSYEKIISRKLEEIKVSLKNNFGVDLEIDKSINELIYSNGVFPTQGTRPVFSTISEIVESSLPSFLMKMFVQKKRALGMFYKDGSICVEVEDKVYKSSYSGVLDIIRARPGKEIDKRVAISVHEAGHAVMYALLFKTAPAQLTAFTTSHDKGGFIFGHDVFENKTTYEDKICVQMAAGASEKIIFGGSLQTTGNSSDLKEATQIAGRLVQYHGMDKMSSYVGSESRQETLNNDMRRSNDLIESIMVEQTGRAKCILSTNIRLLTDVSDYLIEHGRMNPKEFSDVCLKNGVHVDIKEFKEVLSSKYQDLYEEFKLK